MSPPEPRLAKRPASAETPCRPQSLAGVGLGCDPHRLNVSAAHERGWLATADPDLRRQLDSDAGVVVAPKDLLWGLSRSDSQHDSQHREWCRTGAEVRGFVTASDGQRTAWTVSG
jgi:hypothetical protein